VQAQFLLWDLHSIRIASRFKTVSAEFALSSEVAFMAGFPLFLADIQSMSDLPLRLRADHHFSHRDRLRIGWGAIGFVAALLAGCQQAVSDPRPEIAKPAGWTVPGADPSPALSGWVGHFQDPRLGVLVDRALSGSPSLEAASARLRAAAQTARINGAVLWPQVDASLTGSRRRTKSRVADGSGSRFEENLNDNYQAGVTVSWELDYLGRLSDRAKAATATFAEAEMSFRAARLSLVANVARAWFNLLEADSQRALAGETVRSFESNLEVIEGQYEGGLSTALDVRLLRANVASARATLAGRERARDAAARVLEVLVGDYPANAVAVETGLPEAGPPPPAGLPSTLLLRRPDVLAAEHGLEAASLQASAARKALFPSIRLTSATLGRSSDELDALLDGTSTFWNLAGGLTAPLPTPIP